MKTDKELFESTKGIYAINSQSVQAVGQKYLAARAVTKLARDKGLKNQYPWHYKHSYDLESKAFQINQIQALSQPCSI